MAKIKEEISILSIFRDAAAVLLSFLSICFCYTIFSNNYLQSLSFNYKLIYFYLVQLLKKDVSLTLIIFNMIFTLNLSSENIFFKP